MLAVWVGLERQVRFARGWSPVAHALHRLTTSTGTDVGLTDLLDALVRLRDPVADRAVWAFLRANRSWTAWHSTARRLVERRPDDGDLDLLIETTAGRVDGDALQTLVAVLRQRWSYRPLLEMAHRLVCGGIATDGSLAPLVAALHRRGADHQGVVHGWLAGPPRQEQAWCGGRSLPRPYRSTCCRRSGRGCGRSPPTSAPATPSPAWSAGPGFSGAAGGARCCVPTWNGTVSSARRCGIDWSACLRPTTRPGRCCSCSCGRLTSGNPRSGPRRSTGWTATPVQPGGPACTAISA
ncbi:hypothetical protein NKG94_16735 [Micromonospora sp. M12]